MVNFIYYKHDAIFFEILMKLYSSEKPIPSSDFAEYSLTTGKNLFAYTHFLIEKGLVETPRIFQTGKETPLFFKLSNHGKKLVEKIIQRFPVSEIDLENL